MDARIPGEDHAANSVQDWHGRTVVSEAPEMNLSGGTVAVDLTQSPRSSASERIRRVGGSTIRICLLAMITSLKIVPASAQVHPSGDVLTLDSAIDLARANNRETKRAKFDIDRQREITAEAETQLYPRLDTYLLGTELLQPLDFTIKAGELGAFPSTGPIPSSNTDLHTPARPIADANCLSLCHGRNDVAASRTT